MIKWGIIGCGRISHRFMQGLNALPGNVLTHTWSRRAESVNSFVAQYGGTGCNSVGKLLNSDVDAVYIANPSR